jgi:hypothetical protein
MVSRNQGQNPLNFELFNPLILLRFYSSKKQPKKQLCFNSGISEFRGVEGTPYFFADDKRTEH